MSDQKKRETLIERLERAKRRYDSETSNDLITDIVLSHDTDAQNDLMIQDSSNQNASLKSEIKTELDTVSDQFSDSDNRSDEIRKNDPVERYDPISELERIVNSGIKFKTKKKKINLERREEIHGQPKHGMAKIRLLAFFSVNKDFLGTYQELADHLSIPIASLKRTVAGLEKIGFVTIRSKPGRFGGVSIKVVKKTKIDLFSLGGPGLQKYYLDFLIAAKRHLEDENYG
ncbi:MAG: hypothetical protein EOL93_01880 [Epsilonproteobacteria bacterium]|nr:hypothetical protein [Campylobacterota bacterium]